MLVMGADKSEFVGENNEEPKKETRKPSVLKDSFVRHSPHSVVSKCALSQKKTG